MLPRRVAKTAHFGTHAPSSLARRESDWIRVYVPEKKIAPTPTERDARRASSSRKRDWDSCGNVYQSPPKGKTCSNWSKYKYQVLHRHVADDPAALRQGCRPSELRRAPVLRRRLDLHLDRLDLHLRLDGRARAASPLRQAVEMDRICLVWLFRVASRSLARARFSKYTISALGRVLCIFRAASAGQIQVWGQT